MAASLERTRLRRGSRPRAWLQLATLRGARRRSRPACGCSRSSLEDFEHDERGSLAYRPASMIGPKQQTARRPTTPPPSDEIRGHASRAHDRRCRQGRSQNRIWMITGVMNLIEGQSFIAVARRMLTVPSSASTVSTGRAIRRGVVGVDQQGDVAACERSSVMAVLARRAATKAGSGRRARRLVVIFATPSEQGVDRLLVGDRMGEPAAAHRLGPERAGLALVGDVDQDVDRAGELRRPRRGAGSARA